MRRPSQCCGPTTVRYRMVVHTVAYGDAGIGARASIGAMASAGAKTDAGASTRRRLTRHDWVTAALAAIAEGGLAAVAVEPLALRLGTSKGSFYWHFENREALLTAALAHWEEQYTAAVTQENTRAAAADPVQRLRLLIRRVTSLAETDSVYVALIATADYPAVAPVLTRITEHRIEYTAALFRDIGFSAREARYRSLLAYS